MIGSRGAAIALSLVATVTACRPPVDQSASAAAAVRAADSAWAQAFARKDLPTYLSFVDSTASILPPNAAIVTGLAGIRALVESYLGLPGLSGTWQPTRAEAARSGELAYSTGTYELSYNDPSGKRVTERGKYIEVWRKQADGSWRMVLESFNADTPAPGATSD